jgi:sigma-B regulation protein RsbU (phosphoserine phosphatase)
MSETAAPPATSRWEELQGLALRDATERPLLDRVLRDWAREHGSESAALYLEGERGFERLFGVGAGLPLPATYAEPPADLTHVRFAGGMAVAWAPPQRVVGPDEAPLRLLVAFAARVARLKRLLKHQRFQANYRGVELEALYEVGLAVASTLDLGELSEVILLRAVSLLDARRGALYLLERGAYQLVRTIAGDAADEIAADDPRLRALFDGAEGGPVDLLPDASFILGVPIAVEESPRGLLVVADKESRRGVGPFAPTDRRTLGLFANQAAIALENARLHLQALEKERLEREMTLAAEIQKRLLPKGAPRVGGYEIFGWNRPARQVGGDYYDFLPLAEDRLGMIVGDVSGKGIPAALLVSTLHSAARLLLDRIEVGPELLSKLNAHIHLSSTSNKFITLLLTQLEPASGRLRYVNAGHNPGLLLHADDRLEMLESGGLPLGMMPKAVYREGCLELGRGDLLCLYSDGITEQSSPSDEEFAMERLAQTLRAHRERPLPDVLQAIDAAVAEFANGRPQADDQTIVLVRRTP